MKHYNRLITWAVIEKEVKKLAEEKKIPLAVHRKRKFLYWTPPDFKLARTTVWDFPSRGGWAVHKGDYRGNWSPYVPRNLILHYTTEGDLVLDPFVGGGTTLIECKLLGRNAIGVDINSQAIHMTKQRLAEFDDWLARNPNGEIASLRTHIEARIGDARNLSFVPDESVHLICAHPPYLDALKYTASVEGDLSHISDLRTFCDEMENVAKEFYRVLRPGGRCAVLIGDTRRERVIVPVGFGVMERFIRQGFALEETIIKTQNRDQSTEFYALSDENALRFRIVHEYLFIMRKMKPMS